MSVTLQPIICNMAISQIQLDIPDLRNLTQNKISYLPLARIINLFILVL